MTPIIAVHDLIRPRHPPHSPTPHRAADPQRVHRGHHHRQPSAVPQAVARLQDRLRQAGQRQPAAA